MDSYTESESDMYVVVDQQTQSNNVKQVGTTSFENIHGYTIPSRTHHQQTNEYQLTYTNSSLGTQQQQLQFNDGNGICGEARSKRGGLGIKGCLILLSLLVVIVLLAIIAAVVIAFFITQNGLHSANNPLTQLGLTPQSQEAVSISHLSNNITILSEQLISLKSTITDLEISVNVTNSAGLAADLIALRGSVSNLENHINTTHGEVVNLGNSITKLNVSFNRHNVITNNVNSLRSSVTSLESKVNANNATLMALQSKQRRQPVIRMSRVTIGVDTTGTVYARFQRLNSETFVEQGITTRINISSSLNSTSSDNILAYRPNYHDVYETNLATLFLNLEAIYSCINSFNDVSCKLFPSEDDGFRSGKNIFEASDSGANFQIFGDSSTVTYAFAVEGCNELNLSCSNIPRGYRMDFTLVCILPSSQCSDTF